MWREFLGCTLFFALMVLSCSHQQITGSKLTANQTDATILASSGVCGWQTMVPLGGIAEDGLKSVPANHPYIRYMGRVDCSHPQAPAFAYPGVTISAKFTGQALDISLRDYGRGSPTTTNYYNVTIDQNDPIVLPVDPKQQVYQVARNLPAGEHTVEIFKRVESGPGGAANAGKGEFLGLRIQGDADLLPMQDHARRIEFIGDSITCGYGNELATDHPNDYHFTTRNENAYMAFGAITARAFAADYMAVAYSGRGVWRNYDNYQGDKLPDMYLKTLPEDSAAGAWDTSRFTPDVLVVNLGTNDFAQGGVDHGAFRDAYINFLARLRSYYPHATFICAVGPMMSDYWPPHANAWTGIRDDLRQIIKIRQAAGDTDLHYLEFRPQSAPYGEDSHPTVLTHQKMADELSRLIKELKGW